MTTKKNLIKEVLWHRKERVQQLGREAELKRRAEQAEADYRAMRDERDRLNAALVRSNLAATTPGEPRPLKEHDHKGTPHMGHAFAAHDGFPAHQHIGTVPFARATPGETCPTCGSDDPEYDIASHVAPGMRLSHVMLNYPCPDDFHIEKCPNACEDEEFVHTVSTGNGGRSVCMWPGHNQSSTADLDRADHDGRKP